DKQTEHTLKLSVGQQSPPATIAEMAWLAGHWMGNALGGLTEEMWSPPRDGVMLGMFRLIKNGKPVFYEILTLVEENGTIVIRLKHFHANLAGWEEKDKSVEFKFVGKKNGVIHFEGMAFKPEGKDSVTVYLAIGQKDGSVREETFRYTRVKQ
ncbi:MAG: DUF6265 family protein, partial [Blastocatellia bacterium]